MNLFHIKRTDIFITHALFLKQNITWFAEKKVR